MPPAILGLSGRLTRLPAVRAGLCLAAAGELVGDKLPNAPSRTMPVAVAGRMGSGGICGLAVAGPAGAVVGSTLAFGSTFLAHDLRAGAVSRSGLSDLPFALIEDVAAVSLGLAAIRLVGRALPRSVEAGV